VQGWQSLKYISHEYACPRAIPSDYFFHHRACWPYFLQEWPPVHTESPAPGHAAYRLYQQGLAGGLLPAEPGVCNTHVQNMETGTELARPVTGP